MAKKKLSYSSANGSNGGIAGSGIFGHFGTIIQCNANDTSTYCSIMKIFNLLMILIIVLCIIYVGYLFLNPFRK